MRWLACCVLLAGCQLRARATAIHPTGLERTSGGSGSTIARVAPHAEELPPNQPDSSRLTSLELGGFVPFDLHSTRVHLAPGVRIFDSRSILWGTAVGADFLRKSGPGFALEGSVHAGGSSEPGVIQTAVDVFAGITLHSSSNRTPTSVAVGPSVGLLGMPGGHSIVMFGIGVRVTGGPRP